MKIAMLHGPRDLRIEEQDLDTSNLGPDEIWIETQITALKIGTDRGNYEGAEKVPGAPGYPRWVGDSNLGTVRGVGSEVTRFQVGDRVLSRQPHQSELIISQNDVVVKVPDGVHPEDAVFGHLYTLSAHCYRKASFQPGENVAVIGLGVLGLGAVALGPFFGARVLGLGNSLVRLEMAERMGAHAAYMSEDPDLAAKLEAFTDGLGIDLVILTANPWPAYRTAMEIVRPNGRVSIVSLLGRGEAPPDFNPLAMEWFYRKGLSIIAVSGPAAYPYPQASRQGSDVENRFSAVRGCAFILSLMVEPRQDLPSKGDGRHGFLEPKRLITHRFHYTEMAQAYEMAYRRDKSMLGVIFQWQG
jgi:threonine dehydrogenase-like Zn-dependent dehydrogenase